MAEEPNNIIIRMPNWLGDAVMATPVIADVRHRWPRARLTVMTQNYIGDLLLADPHIDEIFRFARPSGWIYQEAHRRLIEKIQKGHYDLGILLTNSLSSAWWFWRGKVRQRIGFKGHWRSWLLTQAVPFPIARDSQHLVLTYKALLAPLGIPLSDTAPTLYLEAKEIEEARHLLQRHDITPNHTLIGINPGAAYGSAKCWLPERFREVTLRLISDPNVRVVFFGDQSSKSLVTKICEGLPKQVTSLAGETSLRQLIALIKCCRVLLTNDSGPMHIAAALKTPLVALFGSTSDVATGPYGSGTVIHKHVECSPCYQRTCPIDFRCMTAITADEVYAQIIGHLGVFTPFNRSKK